MAEYKVNIRFPIKVLEKLPFVYSGPDFRSLTLGAVSDILSYHGLKFQRLYPFTVSRLEQGRLTDLLFCFTFLLVDDDGRLGMFLTNPIPLVMEEPAHALDALLKEAERLARFFRGLFLEIEVNEQALGDVAHPTSLSFISYDLGKSSLMIPSQNFLAERGFSIKRGYCSFRNEIPDFLKEAKELIHSLDDFPEKFITLSELNELKKNSRFIARSCELSEMDEGLREFKLPLFEDTALRIKGRGTPLFKKNAEGYIHWQPDIFEASSMGMTPHLNIFTNLLEETRYTRGKIFEWGISDPDRRLFICLLARGAAAMYSKGIKRFEFARVNDEQKFIIETLEEAGFCKVHAVKILRKELR